MTRTCVHGAATGRGAERPPPQPRDAVSRSSEPLPRPPRTPTGHSPAMKAVRGLIARYAKSEAPVLITGETGTGKEIVARALHEASSRAQGPFVAVNCAAIAEALFESELFGSTRGAYTGAVRDRKGLVGQARGGTLFLDEIGEVEACSQAKLLRFVEDNRYRPVGSSREHLANARILAATNQPLFTTSHTSGFRRDLYYRLAVLKIELPPLRERTGDIPLLVTELLEDLCPGKRHQRITPDAVAALQQWPWPGNVRELRHTIERALLTDPGDWIRELPLDTQSYPLASAIHAHRPEPLVELLAHHRGQLGPVAKELHVSVRTVQRRMKELALNRLDFRNAS